MKIYVAGASKEPERVRAAMTAVRAHGWEVTLDWLADIEAAGSANEGLSQLDRVRYAQSDLRGIDRADVVWLLAPVIGGVGAWVELGYALARGYTVIVSGASSARTIFAALAEEEHVSDLDALASLRDYARGLEERAKDVAEMAAKS